jgi:hypothetical protein
MMGDSIRARVFAILASAGMSCAALAAGAASEATASGNKPPAGSPEAQSRPAASMSESGPASANPGEPPHWSLLRESCEKCHNATDWAGGLALDTLSPDDIATDAEVWEKAVRKLRGRLMPPPGNPQPSQERIDSFVHWMEAQLDAAAGAQPSPGHIGLHRLNRTEYARSIKAMLGLDIDVKTMLPTDVSSDGFDNIAAALRTSPAFLEQYITAARTISRMAIGRASSKPSSREYRVPTNVDQSIHVDGLPLGTRGGMAVNHYFPADGEYVFNIRQFLFHGAGYVTKIDQPHKVILTIDDVRVFERSFGGPEDLKAVDQLQSAAADEMQLRFNGIRVKVKAGQRRVGVAFVARSFAQSDSPLQPIAMLPEMERTPRIPGIDISGPFNVTGVGDTESRRRVFICRPASEAEETPCARQILSRLAEQAFRRPVTDEDLKAPMAFYAQGRKETDFEAGIEAGLTAILSSTKFLYRAETLPENLSARNVQTPQSMQVTEKAGSNVVAEVDGLSMASRLAFLMWSQGPDKELIELGASDKLRDPAVLDAQVSRMLKDPRSQSLVTNFAFQWLNVSKIDAIEPTPELYPDFNINLREGFREEMRLFLDSILRADRSVLDLLSADETFLNERLALHYNVPNVRGSQFRRVRLEDPNRFGLLGKGAILMGTSYGNRTSPVLRGAWILEAVMGTPPSSPPPGVQAFMESEPGKKPTTVRERLEQHRSAPGCNGCHGVMDPLGFALENFDVTGAWRTKDLDAGTVIEASDVLADGTKVASPAQLREALLRRPDQFMHTITEKLMTFALGRALRAQDMPMVRTIVRQAATEGNTFEAVIKGVVKSPAFRMREISAPVPNTQTAQTGPPRSAH